MPGGEDVVCPAGNLTVRSREKYKGDKRNDILRRSRSKARILRRYIVKRTADCDSGMSSRVLFGRSLRNQMTFLSAICVPFYPEFAAGATSSPQLMGNKR